MKKKNPKRMKAGKDSVKFRWAKRYAIIEELAKFYGNDKRMMNTLMAWPTDYLKKLLNWHVSQHLKK